MDAVRLSMGIGMGMPIKSKKTSMDLHFRVLKEPRGFIRLIQFILAIFAFATTSGFSSYTKFSVLCSDSGNSSSAMMMVSFSYPFGSSNILVTPACGQSTNLQYSFASSAQFFVATGVLCFLYTIGIVIVYVWATGLYEENKLVPAADLAISVVLTLFWFIASCAWTHQVIDLKYYTSAKYFYEHEFKASSHCPIEDKCEEKFTGNFASLNVSLIFGFGNFLLWLAGLWFVYKETYWHLSRKENAKGAPPEGSGEYTLPH